MATRRIRLLPTSGVYREAYLLGEPRHCDNPKARHVGGTHPTPAGVGLKLSSAPSRYPAGTSRRTARQRPDRQSAAPLRLLPLAPIGTAGVQTCPVASRRDAFGLPAIDRRRALFFSVSYGKSR